MRKDGRSQGAGLLQIVKIATISARIPQNPDANQDHSRNGPWHGLFHALGSQLVGTPVARNCQQQLFFFCCWLCWLHGHGDWRQCGRDHHSRAGVGVRAVGARQFAVCISACHQGSAVLGHDQRVRHHCGRVPGRVLRHIRLPDMALLRWRRWLHVPAGRIMLDQ